jgi:DNA-binding MarR family transcriptional regulator
MSTEAMIPFETTQRVNDTCLCFHVQRAARALARRFDEALRPLGLTNTQFSLLMALNAPEATSVKTLAERLSADRTTLTAALKPLERRGLVENRTDLADRRGRLLALTDQSRAMLQAAVPIWERTLLALEGRLDETRPAQLRADLGLLASAP